VNAREDIAMSVQWPLNGVMTDDPRELRHYMEEHHDKVLLSQLG